MNSPAVAEILHLAHGVEPAERDQVVAALARLDERLHAFEAGTVKLQLGIKERGTPSQRTILEAWLPGHPPIVATSTQLTFEAAIGEVRDEMVRQITEVKDRAESRRDRS